MSKSINWIYDYVLLLVYGFIMTVILSVIGYAMYDVFLLQEESKMECLKNNSALECGITRSSHDTWKYCISRNKIKDCGRKPY